MTYHIDAPVERIGTDCYKWDAKPDVLPMWVADMDFACAPAIRAAIERRAAHGVFGYARTPERWAQAYVDWWGSRHGWHIEPEQLQFCTGVIPAFASIVRRLTEPGDGILVQSPVYQAFFGCIRHNGRNVVTNPLIYEDGAYRMDFDDLAKKLRDPLTTMMVLCNPANPVGVAWDEADLARVGELAAQNGVVVVADEIHCDVCDPGTSYVPFGRVNSTCAQNSVSLLAPTKAFNIAGIQTSAVAVGNPHLRAKVVRGLRNDEVASPNAFAVDAAVAAFGESGEWLDEMCAYVAQNKRVVAQTLATELPEVRVASGPASYLLWLDCTKVTHDSAAFGVFLIEKAGLWLNEGSMYGPGGQGFMRMNVACPRSTLNEGLMRFVDGARAYIEAGMD